MIIICLHSLPSPPEEEISSFYSFRVCHNYHHHGGVEKKKDGLCSLRKFQRDIRGQEPESGAAEGHVIIVPATPEKRENKRRLFSLLRPLLPVEGDEGIKSLHQNNNK